MAIEQSFLLTGRNLRTQWRAQEESYIAEAFSYTKRNMSMRDFLASVAHAGHEIAVKTHAFKAQGSLIHVGDDFFSIISSDHPRYVQSFILEDIEVQVLGRTPRAQLQRLLRHGKSFRSLLDDIALHSHFSEVETRQGNIYTGTFELFADCIGVTDQENELIHEGKSLIPISGIVSVLYSI